MTFCRGHLDKWICKPFIFVIKWWCEGTGTTATFLGRLTTIVGCLLNVSELLMFDRGYFMQNIFLGVNVGAAVVVLFLWIPSWEKEVKDYASGQVTISFFIKIKLASRIRILWACFLSFDVVVTVYTLHSLIEVAADLAFLITATSLTTVTFPGRTIKDRIAARRGLRAAMRPTGGRHAHTW